MKTLAAIRSRRKRRDVRKKKRDDLFPSRYELEGWLGVLLIAPGCYSIIIETTGINHCT